MMNTTKLCTKCNTEKFVTMMPEKFIKILKQEKDN